MCRWRSGRAVRGAVARVRGATGDGARRRGEGLLPPAGPHRAGEEAEEEVQRGEGEPPVASLTHAGWMGESCLCCCFFFVRIWCALSPKFSPNFLGGGGFVFVGVWGDRSRIAEFFGGFGAGSCRSSSRSGEFGCFQLRAALRFENFLILVRQTRRLCAEFSIFLVSHDFPRWGKGLGFPNVSAIATSVLRNPRIWGGKFCAPPVTVDEF